MSRNKSKYKGSAKPSLPKVHLSGGGILSTYRNGLTKEMINDDGSTTKYNANGDMLPSDDPKDAAFEEMKHNLLYSGNPHSNDFKDISQNEPSTFRANALSGEYDRYLNYKDGGIAPYGHVKGEGTGTSDSIDTNLPIGDAIIPAAVVKQYGVDFFNKLRELCPDSAPKRENTEVIPAKVSNGEFHFSADEVRFLGKDFVNKLINGGENSKEEKGEYEQGEMTMEEPKSKFEDGGIIKPGIADDSLANRMTNPMLKPVDLRAKIDANNYSEPTQLQQKMTNPAISNNAANQASAMREGMGVKSIQQPRPVVPLAQKLADPAIGSSAVNQASTFRANNPAFGSSAPRPMAVGIQAMAGARPISANVVDAGTVANTANQFVNQANPQHPEYTQRLNDMFPQVKGYALGGVVDEDVLDRINRLTNVTGGRQYSIPIPAEEANAQLAAKAQQIVQPKPQWNPDYNTQPKIDPVIEKLNQSAEYTGPKIPDNSIAEKLTEGAKYTPPKIDPYTGQAVKPSVIEGLGQKITDAGSKFVNGAKDVVKNIVTDPVALASAGDAYNNYQLNDNLAKGNLGVGTAIRAIASGPTFLSNVVSKATGQEQPSLANIGSGNTSGNNAQSIIENGKKSSVGLSAEELKGLTPEQRKGVENYAPGAWELSNDVVGKGVDETGRMFNVYKNGSIGINDGSYINGVHYKPDGTKEAYDTSLPTPSPKAAVEGKQGKPYVNFNGKDYNTQADFLKSEEASRLSPADLGSLFTSLAESNNPVQQQSQQAQRQAIPKAYAPGDSQSQMTQSDIDRKWAKYDSAIQKKNPYMSVSSLYPMGIIPGALPPDPRLPVVVGHRGEARDGRGIHDLTPEGAQALAAFNRSNYEGRQGDVGLGLKRAELDENRRQYDNLSASDRAKSAIDERNAKATKYVAVRNPDDNTVTMVPESGPGADRAFEEQNRIKRDRPIIDQFVANPKENVTDPEHIAAIRSWLSTPEGIVFSKKYLEKN